MEIKIFIQPQCPACPQAKELGQKLQDQGKNVKYFNIKEPEGLSEGVMNDVMSTPSIVICDDSGNEMFSYRSTVPSLEEIQQKL